MWDYINEDGNTFSCFVESYLEAKGVTTSNVTWIGGLMVELNKVELWFIPPFFFLSMV